MRDFNAPFRVNLNDNSGWLNLGDIAGMGAHIYVKFTKEHGMIVKKVIPASVFQAHDDDIRYQRDIYRKGTLLGNTQRHWMPLCSMPAEIHEQWKRELGDPKEDPTALRKWRQRLNSSEYRDFKPTEYNV